MVRAFGLYWGGIRFESLSTHHCWALSKSFIPSLVVWSMTKKYRIWRRKVPHLAEKNETKKSNGEQSDLCDLEQVTLKPLLQVHHCLTTWLQIWYHSLLLEMISEKDRLRKAELLIRSPPRGIGEINFLSFFHFIAV